MQRKSKDETGRLMNAIAAVSALPEKVTALGRALHIGPVGTAGAIATEINETVLHRCLTFSSTGGHRLVLEVSERRLLTIQDMTPLLSGRHGDMTGRALGAGDVDRFVALCTDLGAEDAAVFVLSALPDRSDIAFEGIPARLIFEAVQAQDQPDFSQTVSQALAATDTMTEAFVVMRSGTVLDEAGARTLCDDLAATVQARPQEGAAGKRVMAWGHSTDGAGAKILISLDDLTIAVACTDGRMTDCFRLWHRAVFHGSSD